MAYIGNDLRSNEDYKIIDDISSGFNGSETSFALQVGGATPVPFPKFEQQLLISVNGVIQEPDPTGSAGFKLLGTNIVFSSAPTNGHAFFGVIYAGADYVNAGGTFPDGSINFPSITFSADTNTGFTRTASGTVALISDGTKVAQFPTSQGSSGQALITDGGGNLSFGVPTAAFTDITLADSIIHSGDTNTKIRFPAADTVSVETSGSERLRVDSSGNVGIGTTSPNRHLHLHESDSTGATVRFTNTTTGSGENDGLTVGINSSEQAEFWQRENTAMVFATNNTQRMAISASGNVGIGEASPSCGLHIDNPNNAAITQILDTDNTAVKLVFRNNTETGNNIQIGADGSNLVALTGATERMRIDSAGNVGIGTSSPNRLLTLFNNDQPVFQITNNTSGTANTRGLIQYIASGTTDAVIDNQGSGSGGVFRVMQAGNERMRIDSSGRVGIGTTSPSKKLEVSGGGIFANGGTLQASLQGDTLNQLNPALVLKSSSNTSMRANFLLQDDFPSGRGSLAINITESGVTNDRDLLLQRSGGRVAIGGGAPAVGFHYFGSEFRHENSSVPFIRLKASSAQGSNFGDYGRIINDVAGTVTGLLDWKRQGATDDSLFTIFTKQSATDIQERLRLTSKGVLCVHAGQQTNVNNMNKDSHSMPKYFENTTSQDSSLVGGDIHFQTIIRGTSGSSDTLFTFQGGGNCGFFCEVTAYFSSAVSNFQGRQRMWWRAFRSGNQNFSLTQAHNYDKVGTATNVYFNPLWTSSGSGANQVLGVKVNSVNMGAYVRFWFVARIIAHDSINSMTINR